MFKTKILRKAYGDICWKVVVRKCFKASAVDTYKNNLSDTDSETVFAEVIRNISRVNDVLQKLITNYEHLQKLYKSQEDIGSDYNKDDDSDENAANNIKTNNKNLKKKSNDNEGSIQTTTPTSKGIATQIIWSAEANDDDNDDDNSSNSSGGSENKEIKQITPKLPKIESWRLKEKKKKQVTQDDDDSDEKSIHIKESIEHHDTLIKADSSPEANIFVDTDKKQLTPSIIEKSELDELKRKTKTRYVVKEHNQPDKYRSDAIDHRTIAKKGANRNVKNIVYAEKFSSKNIWDEVINKPIQLKEEKVITYGDNTNTNRIVNGTEFSLRSQKVKNATLIVTDNKKKKPLAKSTSDLSDDDEAINKDMFKTKILRKAYGDICWKVVVRKCFKACKATVKRTCMRFKCKSKFKEVFKESAKAGCLNYFGNGNTSDRNAAHGNTRQGNSSIGDTSNGNTSHPVKYRAAADVDGEDLVDPTRGGHLAAACWPHASDPPKAHGNDSIYPDKELAILRDRYERACQKNSRDNCRAACKFSYTKSCAVYACNSRMKKSFKRDCKTQCEKAYSSAKVKSRGSSKDSSSSGSSSSASSSSSDSSDSRN